VYFIPWQESCQCLCTFFRTRCFWWISGWTTGGNLETRFINPYIQELSNLENQQEIIKNSQSQRFTDRNTGYTVDVLQSDLFVTTTIINVGKLLCGSENLSFYNWSDLAIRWFATYKYVLVVTHFMSIRKLRSCDDCYETSSVHLRNDRWYI
jgi:hypothetical protein